MQLRNMPFVVTSQCRVMKRLVYGTKGIFYRLFSGKNIYDWNFRRLKRCEVKQVFNNLNEGGRKHNLAYLQACYDLFPQGWWGVVKENKVLGSFAMHDFEDNATAMSGLLMVDKEYRNSGIGKFLIEFNTSKGNSKNAFLMSASQNQMIKQSFKLSHQILVSVLRKTFDYNFDMSSPFKIVPMEQGIIPKLEKYDSCIHPIPRTKFFHNIILGCAHVVFVALDNTDNVIGYGALRRANEGWRIAPVYGENNDIGKKLFLVLLDQVENDDLITVSSFVENHFSIDLQRYIGFEGIKRHFLMYSKHPPVLPIEKVFTLATLEFTLC